MRRLWSVAVILCLLTAPAAFGAGPSAEGELITAIEVVGTGIGDPQPYLEILGLRAGARVDHSRIREGVHALFAGGEVEHLRLEALPESGGVHLQLFLRLRSRIEHFEIVGVGPVWRARIRTWMELQRGATVSAARLEAGAARVLRELQRRGYAEALVEPSLEYYRATNSVDLSVEVELGAPRELAGLRLEGIDVELAEQLELDVDEGRTVTRRLVDRMRDEVERELRRQGFWEAQVTGMEQEAEGSEVELAVRVDPGPRYGLEIRASEEHEERVRKAFPDPEKGDLHPAQTAVLAERIREQLQLEGYLLARVEVAVDLDLERPVVVVRAELGQLCRVAELHFPGSLEVADEGLRKVVGVRPGRAYGWRGQKISDQSLQEDRAALERLYHERGFAEVVVDTPRMEKLEAGRVRVVFPVAEGRRWRLGELRLESFPVETIARLEYQSLPLVSAGPWRPDRVDDLVRRLETTLANTGYPGGSVTVETAVVRPGEVALTAVAAPGPFVRLGEVVLAGLKSTREEVVRRVLVEAGVVSGAPYSRAAMLEAQNALYELGLFRRVELVPVPGQENRRVRGLVVRCDEGQTRSYLVGVGWDTEEQARLTLGWSHLNLFGGAHAVSVETRVSSRQLRFQASLREPRLPYLNVPGYAVAYSTEEEYATYSQQRRGVWLEVGDRRRRPFRHWYRFEYQIVEPEAPDEVLSELEREEQQIRVASLTPAFEWDRRDDPLNPRRGYFLSGSADYAWPMFAADAEFLKVQLASSWYQPLGRHTTLAAGLRLGTIEPLGPDTGEAPNLQVPIGTRFFAGGQASHRAFALDSLGLPGLTLDEDGNAIGGNALVLLNLELVRPVWGPVAAALFVDAGNVWDQPASVRGSDLRWGVGLGVRYDTPAGPLRLEYGYKLDRLEGESRGEIFLSFGTPF